MGVRCPYFGQVYGKRTPNRGEWGRDRPAGRDRRIGLFLADTIIGPGFRHNTTDRRREGTMNQADKDTKWKDTPEGDQWVELSDFQNNLGNLIHQARMIRIHDGGVDPSIDLTTLTKLATLVEQALGVLGELKRDSAEAASEDSAWPARAASCKALDELGDLCQLVSAELRASPDHRDRLSDESGYRAIFSYFEQADARFAEQLCSESEDGDLARVIALSSTTRHADLCRSSLKVRHLLGKFRLRVATAVARRDTLEGTLLSVGASLAWLRGQTDFSQVRVSDQLIAKDLQERIVAWLRTKELDDEKGRLVWEDITSFLALVDLINHRQALVERDLAAVTDLIALLGDVEPSTQVPEAWAERIQFLLGLQASSVRHSASRRTLTRQA